MIIIGTLRQTLLVAHWFVNGNQDVPRAGLAQMNVGYLQQSHDAATDFLKLKFTGNTCHFKALNVCMEEVLFNNL